jgi:hypothetical protein
MAPEPVSAAPPGKGKPLSLKSPWTWVIVGGIALVGGAFILWRRSHQTASATGSAATGTPDYSGALGTLQDEIGNLQSASGTSPGGGTSVVPVTTPSGGGGTTTETGSTGPATGGNSSGAPAGNNSSSSGTSSSGGGGTTTATAPSVTNGRIVSLGNNRATVAWDGPGATQWAVTRTGPGSPNGITNIVNSPQAVYSGLAAGHNYEIRIQPLVNGKPAGTGGGIDFKTT